MNAVRAGEAREIGTVVDDETCVRLSGQNADLARAAEPFTIGQGFFAQLDHVGPARERLADDPRQIAERGQTADEDHQPRVAQHARGARGGERQFFQRVHVITQHLEPPGGPDVDELGVLFQRAECLGDPFEVRGEHGAGILAGLLGCRHDMRADITARVARR